MDINTIISEYIKAKEQETAAKKRIAALKSIIMDHAKNADNFSTDIYTVVIKTTTSSRLDTAALYRDFPDIKSVYEKSTTSKTITAVVTADQEKKSA